ncbi:MAG: Gx transporter family protein [Butyrivibrio sp.]|nr:Gx transporter family protein [Acetatifactor muris]MCM1559986.1 Gx transporter family protein [Butyrivibrio sp.]
MKPKQLTTLALYVTLSLAVYAIESAIPPFIPIPGIRLGLSNIITLILLHRYSLRETALVLTARILLSTLLFGQFMSFFYSLSGGFLSLLAMFLTCRLLRGKMRFLTGAVGGLTHNLGQLLTAFALTATPGVLAYLPFLVLSGILTGLFTGFAAFFTDKYLLSHRSREDSSSSASS